MSQFGANKVATAVLLDTSPGMDAATSNGITHFERSKWILSRIILRKIFAYETDEVGLLTFGLSGVKTVSSLKVPNWDMFREAEDVGIDGKGTDIIKSKHNGGNWAKGLIKAVDFLEEECQGKRFKSRQLVVLSNFTWSSPDITDRLDTLITIINAKMIKVIVIGVDIKKESQDACGTPLGLGELVEFVSKLDCGYTQCFEEVEEDLKFYDKKKKAKRLTQASMRIGSQINMPFKWMKVTNEDTRLKFAPPRKEVNQSLFSKSGHASEPSANGNTGTFAGISKMKPEEECPSPLKKLKADFVSPDAQAGEGRKFTVDDASRFELKFAQDESRKTRFGATEVLLTYADLEAMKRKTGPPSLTFLGSVRSSKITRSMIVAEDVYVIVSDGTKRSHAQLTALINALLKQNKYGLARRIASKDGKVAVGILYPVSDELGKALYFLKVPLADWVKSVPTRALPDVVEQPLVDMMNDLIDAMSIEGKEGRDLLLRDPNFQTRAALVESRARSSSEQAFPDHISALFDPYPELREAGEGIIGKIMDAYKIPLPPPVEDIPPKNAEIVGEQGLCLKESQKCKAYIKLSDGEVEFGNSEDTLPQNASQLNRERTTPSAKARRGVMPRVDRKLHTKTARRDGTAQIGNKDVVDKKELTEAEKKEVAEIEKLVSCDPDSVLLDGEKLYQERVECLEMETEDIFKVLQSPF